MCVCVVTDQQSAADRETVGQVLWSACLCVCPVAHIKNQVQISPNFLYNLPEAIAQSSSVGNMISYVLLLLVLWMTSCFQIMEQMGPNQRWHVYLIESARWQHQSDIRQRCLIKFVLWWHQRQSCCLRLQACWSYDTSCPHHWKPWHQLYGHRLVGTLWPLTSFAMTLFTQTARFTLFHQRLVNGHLNHREVGGSGTLTFFKVGACLAPSLLH